MSEAVEGAGGEPPPRPRTKGWLRPRFPSGGGLQNQRYLLRWLCISTAIGIVAGGGAIAFTLAIDWITHLSLGAVAGYLPPSAAGEGSVEVVEVARPWLLPLVTALGGLLSGILVFTLAPEAEGHGTDAAIAALHHDGGRMRGRIAPIKLIASAITIGTGGSAGREGPTAQISATFGSLIGGWLGLSAQERRIAVAVGMGAGIGGIFRAPLGGAVMAAEIQYIHDLETDALIPSLIASIVAYSAYGAVFGYAPIFGDMSGIGYLHPIQLLYYAALGVICGFGGLLYERVFYGTTRLFHRLAWPAWLKPAFGGFLVGVIGIFLSGVLHTGYGWVQISMTRRLLELPLWWVLLLPLAKIVATSLSIGSGGSGGIFGPGMVIGGMTGASFWRLTHDLLPQMPDDPAPFVIIGMMALFGGIAHAPLAMMLMVAEMTGNLSLLAPAMVAVAISTALVGDHTVVDDGRVVGELEVRDIMRTYKANLERSVRRATSLSAGSTLFEARVDASSPLASRTLSQAGLPADTLVVSIVRDGETLFPRAQTRLEPGDIVLVMADRRSEPALRQFLEGRSR